MSIEEGAFIDSLDELNKRLKEIEPTPETEWNRRAV